MSRSATRHNRKTKARKKGTPSREQQDSGGPLVWFDKQGSGVDYSVPARALAVTDFSFVSSLMSAQVEAVTYGLHTHPGIGSIPLVGLACTNAQPVREAFKVFHEWSKETDGDAVELTWVYEPGGAYRLIVGPDYSRVEVRCVGFERFLLPIVVGGHYAKHLAHAGKMTHQFRDYCDGWCHPFLFTAVALGPAGPVQVVEPLLKFHARHVNVDQLPIGSMERRMLGEEPRRAKSNQMHRDHAVPEMRDRILRCHFPITVRRMERQPMTSAANAIQELGFSPSQVRQAAANLALSRTLCEGKLHFSGISKGALSGAVTKAVTERFEIGDSQDVSHLFTFENISRQATLDGNALLKFTGNKSGRTPQEVAALLKAADLR